MNDRGNDVFTTISRPKLARMGILPPLSAYVHPPRGELPQTTMLQRFSVKCHPYTPRPELRYQPYMLYFNQYLGSTHGIAEANSVTVLGFDVVGLIRDVLSHHFCQGYMQRGGNHLQNSLSGIGVPGFNFREE